MTFRHLFLLLVLTSLAPAQTRKLSPRDLPSSAFKLIAVKVTGNQRYTPEEITEVAGLKLGQTVSDADFKAASQHLGDSGAFTDVAYSFQYETEGTRLTLQVTEADNLVSTRFDNFVWYSDEELLAKLRERVPLFHGQLPMAGNLPDKISDALQALLDERGVEGRVDYLRSAAKADGPIDAFVYIVKGSDIRIRNVGFAGASAAELPALQAAAKPMEGANYARSTLRVQEDRNLLPVYLARGHLKASLADAQAKVVTDSSKPTLVDVTIPVTPGVQYKTTDVQLSGANAFPAAQLRPMIRLETGQPANAVQLLDDLEAMKKLYGTKGYMAASFDPAPETDDAQAAVKYVIKIREGDVYKMGELTIEGVDKQTTARLQEAWHLRGGDPYDSSYLRRFITDTARDIQDMGGWNIASHETLDDKDKVVDVTIHYDPKTR